MKLRKIPKMCVLPSAKTSFTFKHLSKVLALRGILRQKRKRQVVWSTATLLDMNIEKFKQKYHYATWHHGIQDYSRLNNYGANFMSWLQNDKGDVCTNETANFKADAITWVSD